jgi:excisionase family DNA binding protein
MEALMTEQELAEYVRVSLRTVRKWRAEGTGPPYLRAGRQIRYRKRDVDAWLEHDQRGMDTGQPGEGG